MEYRNILCALAACLIGVSTLHAAETDETKTTLTSLGAVDAPLEESLAREGQAAIDRGIKWLLAQQSEEGHWSSPEFPALTALPLWALANAGVKEGEPIEKAVKFILDSAHEDGSIWREPSEERKGGGLPNYNTALSMVALHRLGDPDLIPVVQRARTFVAKGQHFGDDIYKGGMGYDPDTGRAYADLSNSYIAYEAMKLTESVEDLRAETGERADLDWDAAAQFVSRVQNLPEYNDQEWATDAPAEKGGFAYKPDSSQAGDYTDEEGVVRLRSYGSMTYAGLLSFIYANVDKNDERVTSAFDWAARYWTLDENPGMGQQGLYYFYNVLSKALATYGEDIIELEDGRRISWRKAFIEKLVNLQRIDPETGMGYWVNDAGRWFEADPVLVTAYSLIALQVALP